jgi:hypothetical protein
MSNFNLKAEDVKLAEILVKEFGKTATRAEVVPYCETELEGYRAYNVMRILGKKTATRGEYDISSLVKDVKAGIKAGGVKVTSSTKKSASKAKAPSAAAVAMAAPAPKVREDAVEVGSLKRTHSAEIQYEEIVVPEVDPNYVPFGCFADVKQILSSGVFAPAFLFGHSGYGKTTLTEQACAKLKKKLIVVQITEETTEDDLIGGMRLVNGNTVFEYGPVVRAYQEGCPILLDEVDQGTSKIMCLQNALQAKPLFLKKTGETIYPQAGFMVIATGNTRGIGDDADGRYVGAKILNEAFLERFADTMTQEAPTPAIETKILSKVIEDSEFVDNLVKWANLTRGACASGAIDREVQTRRLLHVAKLYEVYGDRLKAVTKAVNRFDEETRDAMIDLYTKVDMGVETEVEVAGTPF